MATPQISAARGERRQRGQVFIMVALVLAVLGGIVAIAIDVGSMTMDRRDLQNAADSIALAASQELPNQDAARSIANQWAVKNGIDPADMTVTFVAQNPPTVPNPKVTVAITTTHQFWFAPMIGIRNADVSADATAIRTSAGGGDGMMPWSVKKSVKDAATPGQSLVLKYDSRNVSNGNFGALALDGTGASTYRTSIINGSTTPYCAQGVADCSYPDHVDTEPGNMTGPTRQGTDNRIAATSTACDSWNEVVSVVNGKQGLKPECNPFGPGGNAASKRVIIIPVINNLCNGRCNVTIVEFALFFLEGYGSGGCTGNDCEITGRFINSNTNYGFVTGVFDSGSFSKFVRLVD